MDSDTIWRHVDTQRAALADLLEGLPEASWETPSLCAEWTVRDVAAHLTFSHARLREMLWPAVRAGFRFDVMVRDSAIRSPLTHEEIIAVLRGFLGSRRRAPLVSEREPLLDILVHTQDIAVPLGIDRPMPLDAAVVATDRVIALTKGPFRLRRLPRGVRLVATDVDWAWGAGQRVEGEIRWLLLAVAGREVAYQHLRGAVGALV